MQNSLGIHSDAYDDDDDEDDNNINSSSSSNDDGNNFSPTMHKNILYFNSRSTVGIAFDVFRIIYIYFYLCSKRCRCSPGAMHERIAILRNEINPLWNYLLINFVLSFII